MISRDSVDKEAETSHANALKAGTQPPEAEPFVMNDLFRDIVATSPDSKR